MATVLSVTLVDVLTGVFDPPPDFLTIPWVYLLAVGFAVVATVLAAGLITLRALRRPAIEELRDL
jgi:putative ABC transport system permease protein